MTATPGDVPDLADEDPAVWVPLDSAAGADGTGGESGSDAGRRQSAAAVADQVPWSRSVRSVVATSGEHVEGTTTAAAAAARSAPEPSRGSSGTAVVPSSSLAASAPARSTSSTPSRPSHGNSSSRRATNENLQSIQRRLETKQTLKENLVDRPLNQFAGKFVAYLVQEIWRQDYYVRSGLVLLGIGSLMQVFAMLTLGNTILKEYFRSLFVLAVLALSYLYVFRPDETLASVVRFVASSSAADTFLHVLENLDAIQLRRICIVFAMVPTLLEMKAVTFLAATLVEAGWIVNITWALVSVAYLRHAKEKERISSRECSIRGLAGLYVSALIVAITHIRDIRRINTLAAPFVLAAGAFLITNHPAFGGDEFDWLSRAARHALRLTLRDVLATVGQNVGENEMLQLAMMRWVVDYWSRAPDADVHSPQGRGGDPPTSASEPSSQTERVPEVEIRTASTRSNTVNLAHHTERSLVAAEGRNASQTSGSFQSTGLIRANDPDIGWDELFMMLNLTTDQLQTEVHHPQDSQRQPRADDRNFVEDNESVTNLQSMLASFDVDGRAKPAVQAYKATVEKIPPSRSLAIALAIVRRCPATLALLSWYSFGSYDSMCATMTLFPMIWMEVMRLREWSRACHNAVEEESQRSSENSDITAYLAPPDMEPMIIMLSSDSFSPFRPTSSMQVWANVKASVTALESGLTAVRCVQTTYVATELTFDVVSLAKFGVEVYSKGWFYGAALIARDVFHFLNHESSGRRVTRDTPGHGQYTAAAVNAARNSEVVARNVGIIMEEGGNQVIGPVVDALTFVVGRGWLWGTEGEEGRNSSEVKKYYQQNAVDDEAALTSKGRDQSKRTTEVPSNLREEGEFQTSEDDKAADSGSEACGVKGQEKTCLNEAAILKVDECDGDSAKSGDVKVSPKDDETAETMELMAEAFEKGLITENEKDTFVEMLLTEKKSEICPNDSSATSNSAAGIRKSLECILEENSQYKAVEANANDKVCAKQDVMVEHRQGEEGTDARRDASEENSISSDEVASIPLAASAATSESWENSGIENDLVFDNEHDLGSNKGTPLCSNVKSLPDSDKEDLAATSEVEDVFEDDGDEGSWTEIDRDGLPIPSSDECAAVQQPFGGQSIRSMTGVKEGKTSLPESKTEENDGKEDWMKWVGGSLAVAGGLAVAVGGIALANANNQENDSRSTSRREMRNTVTIELLDSDDES